MEKNPAPSAIAAGADGLFLRAADRMRFDYVMHAVCTEGQCLALSSANEGVLDHYGRLIINRLRQTSGLLIEVFLPANTEALLDRFNQILAGLSLTDARKATGSPAPRRLLVVHDARAISPRDLQLLARLMHDFPGANTALVLFLDQSRERQFEKVLESFGQRLLRWPVEAPSRAEGEALLKVGAMLGFGVEVKKLLAATGVVDGPPPKESLLAAQLAAARQDGRTEPVLQDSQARPAPGPTEEEKPFTAPESSGLQIGRKGLKSLSTSLRWLLAAALLLTVSAGVIAVLFPARIAPLLATSPLAREALPAWVISAVTGLAGTPAPVSAVAEKLAAAPAPASEAGAPAASVSASVAEPDNTILPDESDVAPSVSAPTADSNKAEEEIQAQTETKVRQEQPEPVTRPAPVTRVDPVAPLAPVVKAQPATPIAEALAPRSERGVDQQVRRAKAGSYFVQHVSLSSMAEAQEWRAQYPVLGKGLIVAVSTQSQGVKFAVVSGPFASRKDAEVFAGRQGVPADPWLRPVASLQKSLLPGAR